MQQPTLFVPTKNRLELPLDLDDDYVDLEIIRRSKPLIIDLSYVGIIQVNYPTYPSWEEDPDGSSGKIHVLQRGTNERMPYAIMHDNKSVTPLSADGTLIRHDVPTLFSHGIKMDNGVVDVWWGLSNFDIESDEVPEGLASYTHYLSDPALREFLARPKSSERLQEN